MEQKQLDEIDESYFGDEFIEEDLVKVEPIRKDDDIEEIKIENVEDESTNLVEETKTKKKTRKAKAAKESPKEEPVVVETVDPDKKAKKEEPEVKTEEVKVETKSEVKESLTDDKPKVEFNPWDDKNGSEKGLFMEASTWKAITGIAIILLVFSVFTQGFQFSENGVTGAVVGEVEGKVITVEQAQERVLDYVNTQLLQPPFVAEVVRTVDSKTLFKVTLSIAGEEIDSYLTKDGRLFFPQGFDTTYALIAEDVPSQLDDTPDVVVKVGDDGVEEVIDEKGVLGDSEVVVEVVDDTPEPVVDVTGARKVSITAKKWLFSPHELSVTQGDTVSLTINPEGLDFTFVIPELGVEEEVSGTTVVEFVANKRGSFDFSCSSCEEWRGMVGTLEVK